eukprot:182685-Alexandrium_andersonii.AAC.1
MRQTLEGLALIHKERNPALRPRSLGADVPRVAQRAKKAADQILATLALIAEALCGLARGSLEVGEGKADVGSA